MKIRHPIEFIAQKKREKKEEFKFIFSLAPTVFEWRHSRGTIWCYFNNFVNSFLVPEVKHKKYIVGTWSSWCIFIGVYCSKIGLKSRLIMREFWVFAQWKQQQRPLTPAMFLFSFLTLDEGKHNTSSWHSNLC